MDWTGRTVRAMGLLLGAVGGVILGGCGGGEEGVAEVTPVRQPAPSGGPAGSVAVGQLDFFDRLEEREVATWDEMLAGLLLVTHKSATGDYAKRLARAQTYGYVGMDVPARGDTAITPAAFARATLKAQGVLLQTGASGQQVVALAVSRGLLPAEAATSTTLSGATVVQGLAVVGEPGGVSRGLAGKAPGRVPQVDVTETKLPKSLTTIPIVGTGQPRMESAAAVSSAPVGSGAGGSTAARFAAFEETSPPVKAGKKPEEVKGNGVDPNLPRPRPEPLPE